ncbi:MAG: NAD(P)/FAD-dependent oxidoreductase [Candidatus Competibacteraceae bacterium]
MTEQPKPHRIVVVGGGAGGLELVTRLGDTLGHRRQADITLIDDKLTHLWKPLLHQVAAGTLDSHEAEIDYLAQARNHGFHFQLGRMESLKRDRHQVILAPLWDAAGEELISRRTVPYDTLIIAVGSVTNDFGTPGADRYCTFLDSRAQADAFQRHLLESYLRLQFQKQTDHDGALEIAIIGAGATGVELAAELHNTTEQMRIYGLDAIVPGRDLKLSLIEAADRILPPLSTKVAESTRQELEQLGVQIYTGEKVTEVTAQGVHTAGGRFIPARLIVWCAGVKAPAFLKDLGGLETDSKNLLVVRPTLQTTRDDAIFALGDCAACESNGRPVPPRAQAAHQQAGLLVKSMRRRLQGRPLPNYVYRDYGSLVELSRYTTVGTLMGRLVGRLVVEGKIARLIYQSLYKQHQVALFGFFRAAFLTVANYLRYQAKPRLKLH